MITNTLLAKKVIVEKNPKKFLIIDLFLLDDNVLKYIRQKASHSSECGAFFVPENRCTGISGAIINI